jgi:Na+-transporting NADH:ubiquinone oxidoreductase subunit C
MKAALKILIFCLIMGTGSSVLLVGINAFTAARITKNEELRLQSSVLDVLGVPYTMSDALDVFKATVEVLEKGEKTIYKGKDQAVAFEFSGPGVWGMITGIISINQDLKTIRKLTILRQEETPGLGARIATTEYLDQFKNKEVIPVLVFTPAGKAKANNEIDVITGATYSSKALEKLLNKSIADTISLLK